MHELDEASFGLAEASVENDSKIIFHNHDFVFSTLVEVGSRDEQIAVWARPQKMF